MKMAKASETDLDMAAELCQAFDDLENGLMPRKCPKSLGVVNDDEEYFDNDDADKNARALEYLMNLVRRGSLERVVYGLRVVLDPQNKVVDPRSDVLELHPDIVAALALAKAGAAKDGASNG